MIKDTQTQTQIQGPLLKMGFLNSGGFKTRIFFQNHYLKRMNKKQFLHRT